MVIYVTIVIGIAILLPILFLVYLEVSSPPPPITTGTTLRNREGFVIKEIKPENISGKIKVKNSSQVWSATADEEIETGTKVKINEVEGVHLKVEGLVELEEEMEVPDEAEEVSQPEEEIPESAKEVPEPEEEVAEPTEKVPELEEEIPEPTEEVPEPEEEITEPTEEVPEPTEEVPEPEEEITEPTEEAPEPTEEVLEPEEEIIELGEEGEEMEELVELEGNIDEHQICPNCDTVITIRLEECPVCREKLEPKEDLEKEGFFQFFNDIFHSLRG